MLRYTFCGGVLLALRLSPISALVGGAGAANGSHGHRQRGRHYALYSPQCVSSFTPCLLLLFFLLLLLLLSAY